MTETKKWVAVCYILVTSILNVYSQKPIQGSISGIIIEKSSDKPLEFAQVILKKAQDSAFVQGTVSDRKGRFLFEKIVGGEYRIFYSFIGFESMKTAAFKTNPDLTRLNLGKLYISETAKTLNEVEVTGRKST